MRASAFSPATCAGSPMRRACRTWAGTICASSARIRSSRACSGGEFAYFLHSYRVADSDATRCERRLRRPFRRHRRARQRDGDAVPSREEPAHGRPCCSTISWRSRREPFAAAAARNRFARRQMRAPRTRRSVAREAVRRRSGRARAGVHRRRRARAARRRSRRRLRFGRKSARAARDLRGRRRAGADRRRRAHARRRAGAHRCRRRGGRARHGADRRSRSRARDRRHVRLDASWPGIDARGDRVATRGWQNDAGVSRDGLVREVAAWGIERIVYTEIARDGMGSGYDVAALAHVAALFARRDHRERRREDDRRSRSRCATGRRPTSTRRSSAARSTKARSISPRR